MAEPLKFTFDTAFGTRSENDNLNETVHVISQDELDAARTQGFVQGREDGLTEASAQYNSEFAASFEQLSSKLDLLISAQAQTANEAIEHAENYALLIAQKIAKTALNNYPIDQVKTLIDDCLSNINFMPHLVIRVNDEILEITKKELQPIIDQKGYEGKLIILGEPDIAPGDCMIEWADGGVAHNTQEIVQTISNKLADFFGFDVENLQPNNVENSDLEIGDINIDDEAAQNELDYEPQATDLAPLQNDEDDIFGSSSDVVTDALEMTDAPEVTDILEMTGSLEETDALELNEPDDFIEVVSKPNSDMTDQEDDELDEPTSAPNTAKTDEDAVSLEGQLNE